MGHDLVIYIVVGFILVLQARVFIKNLYKIRNYKRTIQQSNNFKIVEVLVDEGEIDNIDVNTLLKRANSQAQANTKEEIVEPVQEDLFDAEQPDRLPEIKFEDDDFYESDDLEVMNEVDESDYSPGRKNKKSNDETDDLPF